MTRAKFRVNDIVKLKRVGWGPENTIRYRITKVGELRTGHIPEMRLYNVHYWSPKNEDWMTSMLYEAWIEKAND